MKSPVEKMARYPSLTCGPPTGDAPEVRRREVVGLLAALLPGLAGCLSPLFYRARREGPRGSELSVPAEEVARLHGPGDVLWVRAEGVEAPILLRRLPGDRLVALAAVCTHRGCQVEARPSGYDCPCHGSQFDLDGAVTQGPADKPLLRLPIVTRAGGIAIVAPG